MIVILSPAKKMINREIKEEIEFTEPRLLNKSTIINNRLKKLNPDEIGSVMKISEKLRLEVFSYIHNFKSVVDETMFPCIFRFNGEAFRGLNIEEYSKEDLRFANEHLRVLSGLYGVLRPLDLIKEYRLEMGSKINIDEFKNLYEFWGDDIKEIILKDIKKTKTDIVVNLASEEYSKAVKLKTLPENIKVINPIFKEYKNGSYKIVTVHAKRARGLMASFIMKNKIEKLEDIKKFDLEGYKFREDLSNERDFIFTK